LSKLGQSAIAPICKPELASWFRHACSLHSHDYTPDVVIYPEIYQPRLPRVHRHICFALGKYAPIQPHADLTVCKSLDSLAWIKRQLPGMPVVLIRPSIQRTIFEYDGRPKRHTICCMPRSHKHPTLGQQLRETHGDAVVEITNCTETEVAESLKSAKVFVWRGNDQEGSPRPPKEALVAGCVVVGLESELHCRFGVNFGVRCRSVEELVARAGEALHMPIPSSVERSLIRDSREEELDWQKLIQSLCDEEKP